MVNVIVIRNSVEVGITFDNDCEVNSSKSYKKNW